MVQNTAEHGSYVVGKNTLSWVEFRHYTKRDGVVKEMGKAIYHGDVVPIDPTHRLP